MVDVKCISTFGDNNHIFRPNIYSHDNQSLLYFETENKFDFAIFILSNHYINNILFICKKKHLEKVNGFIWAVTS